MLATEGMNYDDLDISDEEPSSRSGFKIQQSSQIATKTKQQVHDIETSEDE